MPPKNINVWRGIFLIYLLAVVFLFWLLHKLLVGMG